MISVESTKIQLGHEDIDEYEARRKNWTRHQSRKVNNPSAVHGETAAVNKKHREEVHNRIGLAPKSQNTEM